MTNDWQAADKPAEPQTEPMPAPKRPDPGQIEIRSPEFPPRPTTREPWIEKQPKDR